MKTNFKLTIDDLEIMRAGGAGYAVRERRRWHREAPIYDLRHAVMQALLFSPRKRMGNGLNEPGEHFTGTRVDRTQQMQACACVCRGWCVKMEA